VIDVACKGISYKGDALKKIGLLGFVINWLMSPKTLGANPWNL
jgi:hypothetical protein